MSDDELRVWFTLWLLEFGSEPIDYSRWAECEWFLENKRYTPWDYPPYFVSRFGEDGHSIFQLTPAALDFLKGIDHE